jgi:chemotaxis protein MotB
MMRRKRHEESENLDRWLVSYADFITLLFAFFVILYAISSVNEGKYRVMSNSLVAAFKEIPRTLDPVQIGEINRIKKNAVIEQQNIQATVQGDTEPRSGAEDWRLNLKDMALQIEAEMSELIEQDLVNVRRSDNWLEVEINTNILFRSGSAALVDKAEQVLDKIAAILAPYPNPINVEGFTDDVPINTLQFPSNWELSAARAASVVHLFSRQGVKPDRMSAIAYGQYRPIASNDTEAGRRKNRRVILAILAEDFNMRDKAGAVDADELESTGFPAIKVK